MRSPDFSLLRSTLFLRDVFAEFFATTFFLWIVTSVLTNIQSQAEIVQVSFCIGLAIACLVHIFGPTSGAHINPAVTVGMLVYGKIEIIRACFYVVAQIFGGILGSALTYALTPDTKHLNLGAVSLDKNVHIAQGMFVELFLTMILMLVVLSSTDEDRDERGFPSALAIGLAVTLCHLVGIPYTGASINPTRAFGPAAITGAFQSDQWVYWVGPILGASFASFIYKHIIKISDGSFSPSEKDATKENVYIVSTSSTPTIAARKLELLEKEKVYDGPATPEHKKTEKADVNKSDEKKLSPSESDQVTIHIEMSTPPPAIEERVEVVDSSM